jgi:hypothetical protein
MCQLRVMKSSVKGREVKCLNAIAGGEGPRLYVTDLSSSPESTYDSHHLWSSYWHSSSEVRF